MTGQPASSFADVLRQLRAEAGLTQEELAQAAGLGLRTVSDLERGIHRTAHQDTARLLANGLGLADPVRGLFVAAARGRVLAGKVLAARQEAPTALAAAATGSSAVTGVPVPRELPADVGAFTGRAVELAELDLLLPDATEQDAVAAGPVVISAVSGTAGVGKTALAVRWAHRAAEWFPDGQLYVNLRGYDPDQPLPPGEALAGFLRALGMADQSIPLGESERAARYRSLVAGKRLLVVLDNAATDEQVRPLLPDSPSVTVVVTSRDSLAGLVACDGARRLDLDLLPSAEAVALLTTLIGDRAHADPVATEVLTGQCARLPLVLRVVAELAVSRPDTTLAELAAELDSEAERLELLDTGGDPRSAVAGVFSWSYRHLPEEAARMFRLLGLHPAQDWEEHAAAALTATDSVARARRLLDVLARAHLIQWAGAGRYQMHDLLRAYAASQAQTHDPADARQAALTRLFDYYLAASAAAMDRLAPAQRGSRPDPPAGMALPGLEDLAAARAWLDGELASLTTIAAHTARHGWPRHSGRLAATLHRYLAQGHFTEGLTIQQCALDAARSYGDSAAQARALTSLGLYLCAKSRYRHAADFHEQALAMARDIGDLRIQATALANLALVQQSQGEYQHSTDSHRQALTLFRELGPRWAEARMLGDLGVDYLRQGRYQQATDQLQQALAVSREIYDRYGEAETLISLGEAFHRLGRYEQSVSELQQALTLSREIGDRLSEAETLSKLGVVCHRLGDYDQSADCQEQALSLHREAGNRDGEADALIGAGETLLATGQPEQAQACHTTALTLSRQSGNRYQQARALTRLGRVCHRLGNYHDATGHYQQALGLYREIGDPGGEADALIGAGETLLATGQPEQAQSCHITALTLSRKTGDRFQRARAHHGLAAVYNATGKVSQARQHWKYARDIYTDLGIPEAAERHTCPKSLEQAPAQTP